MQSRTCRLEQVKPPEHPRLPGQSGRKNLSCDHTPPECPSPTMYNALSLIVDSIILAGHNLWIHCLRPFRVESIGVVLNATLLQYRDLQLNIERQPFSRNPRRPMPDSAGLFDCVIKKILFEIRL